jgi:hypothetical protein
MKKFFFSIIGIISGVILGVAIFATVVFIREKNINNKLYIP